MIGSVDTFFDPQFSEVIVIGAGLASDLHRYLAMGPKRVWLIEPNPDLSRELMDLSDAHDQVEFLGVGVAPESGTRELQVFNLFDYSSFEEPTGLTEQYPGLKRQHSPRVSVLSPSDLMSRLNSETAEDSGSQFLIIDTPGFEEKVICSFVEQDCLTNVSVIEVKLTAPGLFEGGTTRAEITDLISPHGFRANSATFETVSDENCVTFMRDPLLQSLSDALVERDKAKTALDAAKRDLEDKKKSHRKQLKRVKVAAKEALQSALNDAEELRIKLSEETNAKSVIEERMAGSIAELEALNTGLKRTAEAEVGSVQQELEAVRKQLKQAEAELAKAKSTNLEISGALRAANDRFDEAEHAKQIEIRSLQVEISRKSREIEAVSAELSSSYTTLQDTLDNARGRFEIDLKRSEQLVSELEGELRVLKQQLRDQTQRTEKVAAELSLERSTSKAKEEQFSEAEEQLRKVFHERERELLSEIDRLHDVESRARSESADLKEFLSRTQMEKSALFDIFTMVVSGRDRQSDLHHSDLSVERQSIERGEGDT